MICDDMWNIGLILIHSIDMISGIETDSSLSMFGIFLTFVPILSTMQTIIHLENLLSFVKSKRHVIL